MSVVMLPGTPVMCPLCPTEHQLATGLTVERLDGVLRFFLSTCHHTLLSTKYEMVMPTENYVAFMKKETDGAPGTDQDDAAVS